jgi:hypothetical protein
MGLMPSFSPQGLDWYLQRGTFIHLATELYDRDDLDESSIDPQIAGYLESYKKMNLSYRPEEIEIRLCDKIYQIAGTLDRLDCDLKSGVQAKWHMIQASIYWHLKKINGLGEKPLRTIYLQEDGSIPKIQAYTIKDMLMGTKVFLSALFVMRWKRKNWVESQDN